jgi:hypothetical protein
MKRLKRALAALLVAPLAVPLVFGQADKPSSPFVISLSGYIKTDI